MKKLDSPIETIEWIDPKELKANDYNPNVVFTKEMRLLEFSMKRQGWIQPILVAKSMIIIDGFHRYMISKKNDWLIPCCVLDIDETERKLLTIRINRAKGSHVAVKMSDIIKSLIADGVSVEHIAEGIGGDKAEVELLSRESVFEKFNLDGHEYSRSWVPRNVKKKKNETKKSL